MTPILLDEVNQLSRSKIEGENLIFDSNCYFDKALQDGIFLLKIPKTIDLLPGIKLCHNFYKEKSGDHPYRGFKEYNSIYFDREHFQTEHILTDKETRDKYFPQEAKIIADEMNELAILVLKNVLEYIGIPKEDWALVTGNCIENQGTHWFACSHYRSEIDKQGCATHQDTGLVTILYIEQSGLEAKINNQWQQILPVDGYFIVNFGRSFEILTAQLSKSVKSILHRVRKIEKSFDKPDRVSMAAFINIPSDLNLYQYVANGELIIYQSVQEFLIEFNKTTWDDKYTEFGLTS
jgi:2OG-Fe(II) oxygenase superfamily